MIEPNAGVQMRPDWRAPVVLGRTGLSVGRIGIGASYGAPAAAIERAFHECGSNYFYWGSIRKSGMRGAIRSLAPQHRDDLVIALQSYDRTGALMGAFVERALRSLRVERADILILGWWGSVPPARIMDAAVQLRESGRIRFIALSGHHRPLFADIANDADSPIDVLMCRYSAAHRGAEREIFAELPTTHRPGVTCYTATRWGQLLDSKKMPPGEAPLTASDCYRFVLSNPDVDVCITGPANAAQVEEALRTIGLGPLDGEEMARVVRIGDFLRRAD